MNCGRNCDQGRACSCAPAPAEACTELGADTAPLPRFCCMFAPAFDRWPRASVAVAIVLILALFGFAGQLDMNSLQEVAP